MHGKFCEDLKIFLCKVQRKIFKTLKDFANIFREFFFDQKKIGEKKNENFCSLIFSQKLTRERCVCQFLASSDT